MIEVDLVELHRVRLPLRRPFRNADHTISVRELVLCEIRRGEASGWGEAAPYPGQTADDIEQVWADLVGLVEQSHGLLNSADASAPSARAAIEGAVATLEAAAAGRTLAATINASATHVRAGATVGLGTEDGHMQQALEQAAEDGYRWCKLKTEPGREHLVAKAVRAFPEVRFGVDANGSYNPSQPRDLEALAGLGLAFIEQPFPIEAKRATRSLRQHIITPVALDESLTTLLEVERAIADGAADILTIKPGRLGWNDAVTALGLAQTAGIGVRVGGLVHSAIGKAQCVALAAAPGVTVFGDLTATGWHLADDVGQMELDDGHLAVPSQPGLGLEVSIPSAAVVDHLSVSWPNR